jgi:hypothetical protein
MSPTYSTAVSSATAFRREFLSITSTIDGKEIAIKRAFVDLAPGDFNLAERLPLTLGNARDRRLHRSVLIPADREGLAGFLAPIEGRSVIRRTVGTDGADPLVQGHGAFAKFCRNSGFPAAGATLRSRNSWPMTRTCFRYTPHHRHVTILALVIVPSLELFRHDLCDRPLSGGLSRG